MSKARLQFHHALYQWWGVPSRYVQLVDHLDPARFVCTTRGAADVVDLATFPAWQRQMLGLIEPDLRRQGLPWYNANDLAAEAATYDLCRGGTVDIVHFLDGEHSGPWLPQHVQNRHPSVRTVATFHQPPSLAEQVINGPALRHLDAVVLMAPSQVPFFARYVPQDRLHVILHGVDTDFFHPVARPHRHDRLQCITTGLHLRDWDAFHAVANALPDIHFTVVTSARVSLKPLPNVRVLSGLSDTALAEAYRAADVLFLPLTDATANNSLLEGMASGLPVVSTDLQAVRAYVPDSAGLLVEGNKVQPLVAALSRLAGDAELRGSMGAAARHRAEALSWARVAAEYATLYTDLLATPRPAAPSDPGARIPALRRATDAIASPAPGQKPWMAADGDAFATLSAWSEDLRAGGLWDEAGIVVSALVAAQPAWPASQAAEAAAAEADWRWSDAATHWNRVLLASPERLRPTALARKASAMAQSGAISAALGVLDAGRADVETRLAAARIAAEFSTPEMAEAAWLACTTQYPDKIEGFLGLARHHLREARFDAAETLLDHVRDVWPSSHDAAALWAQAKGVSGGQAQAHKRWQQALATHGPRPGLLLPLARQLGHWSDATTFTVLLDEADPDESLRTEMLLRFHAGCGDWIKTAEFARRAVVHQPKALALRHRCADVLLHLGTPSSLDEALDILVGLRHHALGATVLLPSLARALIANGKGDEAITVIDAIPAERDDRPTALLRLWRNLWIESDAAALKQWQALVLGFGLSAISLD